MSANKSLKLFATLSAISLLFNLSTRLLSSARGHCECATCGASLCKVACDYDCSQCCRCCIYFEVRVGRAAFPPSAVLGPAVDVGASHAAIGVASDEQRMYLPDIQTNDDGSKPGRDKMEAVVMNGGTSGGQAQLQSTGEVWPPSKALLLNRFLQYLYEPNHEQH